MDLYDTKTNTQKNKMSKFTGFKIATRGDTVEEFYE